MSRTVLLGAVCTLVSSAAFAHITLEHQQASVGSSYKAVLRVPHGCEGSTTTAIRVRIPEGFVGVKPMPKPGWKLDVSSGRYPQPGSLRGAKVSEGVTQVDWSGGKLPDAYYDEFVLNGYLSDDLSPGQTMYFRIVQECEKGVNRWIEIPSGPPSHDDQGEQSHPAAGLKLLPRK
jgi:uncharacterized protein YcnI